MPDDVEIALSEMRLNYETAMRFADTVIKGGFALNGGALVALPTFAALFRVDPTMAVKAIVASISLLIAGLFAAWAVAGLGYLGATAAERRDFYAVEQARAEASKMLEGVKAAYQRGSTEHKKAERYRAAAAIAGGLSLTFFIAGSVIGGWVLMTSVGTAAQTLPASPECLF